MATSRAASRAASQAREGILAELKEDHKRVKKAYRDFKKAESAQDTETCEAIVQQVLQELTVHAAVEEELLYPAARAAVEEDLIDEAEVEHESLHALIDQLKGMSADDEKYMARFTVLCEYVLHHVKEEEGEMFPQLEKARLDWESMAAEMASRRAELMPAEEEETGEEEEETEVEVAEPAPSSRGRGARAGTAAAKTAASGRSGGRGANNR